MKKYKKLPPPKTGRLHANHTWKAPDGYKIVVVDRGVASFNIPSSWVVTDMEPFTMRDKPVPDDNAGLQVTAMKMPPNVDWSGLPLAPLLVQAVTHETELDILERSEVYNASRPDTEIVWLEDRFMDPKEKREAYSRHGLARGYDVHTILTFSYWTEDAPWCKPIWDEVLRSLQLGRVIKDPLKGPTLH